jgi:DNA polymerase V
MGIPMGAPEFKYRDILRRHDVTLFSGNFELYGDFSRRVVEVIEKHTPYIEVYSVDESFLGIGSLLIEDYESWAKAVGQDVLRRTGIPVSIGVAPSKTLAKAAAELAKQDEKTGGVFSFIGRNESDMRASLNRLPVEDVWGIGWRLAPKLKQQHIRTAGDLADVTPRWARQHLTVRGERLVRELRGEACYGLSQSSVEDGQKTIAATRSFGRSIRAIHELETAVASFAARAAVRLRKKHQIAGALAVFVRTGKGAIKQYGPSVSRRLPYPTADTSVIVAEAMAGLQQIYDQNYGYRKAGVVLHHLLPESAQQTTFNQRGKEQALKKRDQLMHVLDEINAKYGTKTIRTAAEGARTKGRWYSKREHRSQAYTTNWQELAVIN